MFDWLRRILRTDEELVADIEEEFNERIEKLEDEVRDLNVRLADIDDKVYPTLKKLSTRAAVRESREKSETETFNNKKGGIMRYGHPLRSP